MKPRILIYFSFIALAIVAGVAVSQTSPVTIGIYAPDALNVNLINSLGEKIFETNVEIVTFYNLAEVENGPKLDLFIASLYPTLIYSNNQRVSVLLESKQKAKLSLVASRSTKINSPEELKGCIVGVGPIDDSLSYLLAVLELRPLVDDIRIVPDRMGIFSIPNTIAFKELDRQDRRAQLSHNKISAAFFDNDEDLTYGRVILEARAPLLFVTSTLKKEESNNIKELLINYEPTENNQLPSTSTQRTETQKILSEMGFSFSNPTEFNRLENKYKQYKEDLPY